MKCLVFSDSHRNTRNMMSALSSHPDAEVIFFLGDGISDAELVASGDAARAWLTVAGNCDYEPIFIDSFVKKTEVVTLEGQRIVYTHGDLYGAKYGIGGLTKLAAETKANIVLFGHTHRPLEQYISTDDGGFYLFNPGSIGAGSYGVMLLREDGVLLSHGNL